MPEDPTLPILTIKPDKATDMKDILKDPDSLLEFNQDHMAVDSKKIQESSQVIRSQNEPSPADRNKVWLKNSSPCGIGVFCDGAWQISTIYPVDVAMVWVGSSDPPNYLRKLSTSEKLANGFQEDSIVVSYAG